MPWEEMMEGFPGRDHGTEINSPVTIVGDRDGKGCGGPTIDLKEYSDYILRKFQREREWGETAGTYPAWPGGTPGWGPNMSFSAVQRNVDSPLKAIGSVTVDAQYVLTMGLICKVAAAGAGTVTLTVTYYDILTGSQTVTLTMSLTAAAATTQAPLPVFLLGGSAVTVSAQNSGLYNSASYDAFVGLQRVG